MNNMNKKKLLAGTMASALLVTGTFAWQSFSQVATNEIIESVEQPGARLHDYFNGTNKDIFVENYGEAGGSDVFARIRLSEYLEYGKDAGMGTGSSLTIVRGDIENDTTPEFSDEDTWDIYDYSKSKDFNADTYDSASNGEIIRQYRGLVLGGTTKYMPTFNLHPYSLEADVNGTFLGTDGDGRTNIESRYDDYVDYTDADNATKVATEYEADPSDLTNPNVTVQTGSQTHTVDDTADASIMLMADWVTGGCVLGDVWVFDTDGWAYYAKPIPAASASGLLLNSVEITSNPADEWYYAINVTAQFASAGDWGVGTPASGSDEADGTGMYAGGMTENGLYLLNKAAGLITVENMTITKSNGDSLEASDTELSSSEVTFGISMEVVNGNGATLEKAVTWTATSGTIDASTGAFTAANTTDEAIITATSLVDPSKSVSITLREPVAS